MKNSLGGNKSISATTSSKVKAYYVLDSISRQAPGKKDFVTSWKSGMVLIYVKYCLLTVIICIYSTGNFDIFAKLAGGRGASERLVLVT